jgi:[acyl-carrier-protein] S-malonyltransferase
LILLNKIKMQFALVFPGQGSQSVAMMQPFADFAPVKDTFAEASEALGQDLWKLVAEGPAEQLNATVNTQPVMLTAGYAVFRAWRQAGGPMPAMVAGHSLGEYTALVAAGVITFKDALPLVRFRAQAMQEAVPMGTGAMAAILGLDDNTVRAACAEASRGPGDLVEAVNFNAPSQVVIAGHQAAVERGMAVCKEKGARRALALPVSAPFHSSLLKPAADRLADYLKNVAFSAPQIPVVNNVDVAVVNDPAAIKAALARQACSPVRWVEVIRHIAAAGIKQVAECGPGQVLSGMTQRIEKGLTGSALTDPAALTQMLEAVT